MTEIYPYLILVGSSILVATAWLLYQYRMYTLRSDELIRLNEELEYDLPNFLRQCWPILRSGKFTGFSWKLNWFGSELSESYGFCDTPPIEQSFDVQDVALTVCLFQKKTSWEQRYFSSSLTDHLFLLVRMNLWIKVGTVQGAFDQSAKMAVFLQHDMKNMLQLITLTADQLDHPVPGKEDKLIENLQRAIPAVRARAEHMLQELISTPARGKTEAHNLAEIFEQTANMYELPIEVNGNAMVNIQGDNLQSIVDNLIGNYARQAQKQNKTNIHVDIEINDSLAKAEIKDLDGPPYPWPERLFEPFWSEHGSGRGIGLYQARQQATLVGGNLQAESLPEKPLKFVLLLPVAV